MSRHRVNSSTAASPSPSSSRLDVSDVLCHICLGIFIEPVTMPCKHRMCYVCFTRNLEINSLNCPMCKKRIGTWARRCSKKLVDAALWAQIQSQFPERVALRQDGVEEDAGDLDELFPCVATHLYAEAGSIREEFERGMEEERRERAVAEEEQASEELARRLQLEQEEEKVVVVKKSPSLSQGSSSQKSIKDMMVPKAGPSKPRSPSPALSIPREVLLCLTDADMDQQLNAFKRFEQEQRDQELAARLAASPLGKENSSGLTPTRGSSSVFKAKKENTPKGKRSMKQLSLKETFKRVA